MEHQVDHRNLDHGLAVFHTGFIVLAQSPISAKPCKRSLDDPSLGQHLKALDVIVSLDDRQQPLAQVPGPCDQLPGIAAISPDQRQSLKSPDPLRQDQPGTISILHIGSMNHHRQNQTQRIDDDMAFAAQDLLAGVVAPCPPFSAVFTD